MKGNQLITLCLALSLLSAFPIAGRGEVQENRTGSESSRDLGEVGNPEEVRRGVESKPYDQTINEAKKEGSSRLQRDLYGVKRGIARMLPPWVTKKLAIFLGAILILGYLALHVLKAIEKKDKKKAMRKLDNIREG